MPTAALIVAAGRGSRAHRAGHVAKQYANLDGRSLLSFSVAVFSAHSAVDCVVVVINPEHHDLYEACGVASLAKVSSPVAGGATRQASVLNGLEALAKLGSFDRVLVHDAARPFVDCDIVDRVVDELERSPGAIAALPVHDTLKRAQSGNVIAETVERAGLWRAQTPQGFHFGAFLEAHRKAADAGVTNATDDAAIAEWASLPVALVAGSERNTKVTTEGDLDMARQMVAQQKARDAGVGAVRVGTGFDVHKFGPGDHVWLCGVKVAHTSALVGHSDADVGLHALTDALLGAIGDGDIGAHFPPSEPQWRDAASRLFLADAGQRVKAFPARISNVDVTLVCEAPKIGPYRDAMRAEIAGILGIDVRCVSVKATTTEQLGFTGRREGIGAIATATVISTA